MRGKLFDIAGRKWKTIESFQPPIGVPCYIRWNGWETRAQDLIERDWIITKVTNRYTGKIKLYVRDPVTKLMGAGELMERQYEGSLCRHFAVDLNYFCHERNQRIRKFIQQVENEKIVRITEDNISVVLEHIAEIQKKTAKPKKRKKVTEVEILRYRAAVS